MPKQDTSQHRSRYHTEEQGLLRALSKSKQSALLTLADHMAMMCTSIKQEAPSRSPF